MRAAVMACALLAASAALAFHVQVGVSAKESAVGEEYWNWRFNFKEMTSPYVYATKEVGATAGYLNGAAKESRNKIYLPYDLRAYGGIIMAGALVIWEDPDDPESVRIAGAYEDGVTVKVAEAVRVGTTGSRLSDVVLTVRGDPYSTVFNDTEDSLTVNGVTIGAGCGARLKFPIRLKMDEVEGLRFYDMNSVEELSATYSDGAYLLGWTGDIRISSKPDNSSADIAGLASERLVYGDLKTASENRLLYAHDGNLVYSEFVPFNGTNIALNVWWDFSHEEWGPNPVAYINGSNVCGAHSTTHIIPYEVAVGDPHLSSETRVFTFTASLAPDEGYSGGNCAIRCFDQTVGNFANAAAKCKAEVAAGLNTATFRLTIGPYGLWWKVEAVN